MTPTGPFTTPGQPVADSDGAPAAAAPRPERQYEYLDCVGPIGARQQDHQLQDLAQDQEPEQQDHDQQELDVPIDRRTNPHFNARDRVSERYSTRSDGPDLDRLASVRPVADEPDNLSEEPPEPQRHRELNKKERAAALVVGALVIAAGFWTLFFAKNNGAVAVAVAFVGGAILLLMAVQGTPLIKLGGKDVSVELSPRDVVRRAEQIAATSPAEAKGFIEGVAAASPATSADPAVARAAASLDSRAHFVGAAQDAVRWAALLAYPNASVVSPGSDGFLLIKVDVAPQDDAVTPSDSACIAASPVYWDPAETVTTGLSLLASLVGRARSHRASGILVVSNRSNTAIALTLKELVDRGGDPITVEIVGSWIPMDGPRPIADAVLRLKDSMIRPPH